MCSDVFGKPHMRLGLDHRMRTAGFTLIELLIASMLTVIVLAIAGGLFVSTLGSNVRVQGDTQAASAAQLIASSVRAGVRNASAVQVSAEPDGGSLIIARTADRGTSLAWSCRAWYYSASEHGIYTKSSTPATAIPAPPPSPDSTWTLLNDTVDNPVRPSGTRVTPVFSPTGDGVSLDYTVAGAGTPAVQIEAEVYPRIDTSENTPCF